MTSQTLPQALIESLGLIPLDPEGGFFAQTYKSDVSIETSHGRRALVTSIYYLLTPQTFSAFHRVRGVEVFHFYGGDPVEQFILSQNGELNRKVLGMDILAGQRPQAIVEPTQWQAMRVYKPNNYLSLIGYSLLGTTVSPGFEFEDFELAKISDLLINNRYSLEIITSLTRQ